MSTNGPKTLSTTEAEKLLAQLKGSETDDRPSMSGVRNFLMGVLMLDAGLRVGELVQLRIDDLQRVKEPLKTLSVRGVITKTKLPRLIPLSARIIGGIEEMIFYWWDKWTPQFREFAFYSQYPVAHLSVRQVERIIGDASDKAFGRKVHPHVLRHTFGTNVLRTSNIRVTQELLGHKSLTSTQVYTHPNSDDLRGAIDSLSK